tara:strand:+ start:7966 stop:8211 length:246 start_codon:yes stop_codon:yes gene_type:complete
MNIHQRRRLERQAAQIQADTGEVWAIEGDQLVKQGSKHTEADLMKLTKNALEDLGRSEFNIELDKRKTKSALVAEILNAQG